jgi:hypothetical protein
MLAAQVQGLAAAEERLERAAAPQPVASTALAVYTAAPARARWSDMDDGEEGGTRGEQRLHNAEDEPPAKRQSRSRSPRNRQPGAPPPA